MNSRITRHILIVAGLLICPAVLLRADIGFVATRGSDEYRLSTLSVSARVAKPATLGFSYTQAASSSTALAKTFAFSLDCAVNDHLTFGGNFSVTPQVDSSRASSWGFNGTYSGGDAPVAYDVSLGLVHMVTSEETTQTVVRGRRTLEVTSWNDLNQTAVEPGASVTFFDLLKLHLGASLYGYDMNLRQQTGGPRWRRPLPVDPSFASLDGYPAQVTSLGVAVGPVRKLLLSVDGAHTTFASDQPDEDSLTFGLTYTFFAFLEGNASLNSLSNGNRFVTLGLKYLF